MSAGAGFNSSLGLPPTSHSQVLTHSGNMTTQSLAKLKPFGDAKNSTGGPQQNPGSSILPSMMSLNITNTASIGMQRSSQRSSAHQHLSQLNKNEERKGISCLSQDRLSSSSNPLKNSIQNQKLGMNYGQNIMVPSSLNPFGSGQTRAQSAFHHMSGVPTTAQSSAYGTLTSSQGSSNKAHQCIYCKEWKLAS